MSDLSRLALHTFTTRPWSIHECIDHYAARGIGGISIWKETVEGEDLARVRRHLEHSDLTGISYVRGGFFTGSACDDRARAITSNLQCLRDCAELGLPMLVLVCGATPGQTPRENLAQIRDGIAAILPEAEKLGIRLAIEPLHPKYAGDRSAIATLKTANNLCDHFQHPLVGVAFDVYHVWWDLDLEEQTRRCASAGRLWACHICDFKPAFEHPLLDRGLMGEGCIPLRDIDAMVTACGFTGFREVEIFSRRWWSENQHHFLDKIVSSYQSLYPNQPSS
jgi:sugar phosphate isomerase/epimerase